MDQLKSYADERLMAGCVYCGRATETRDHVPSRVLLDEPYPENLPVVPSCEECNRGYSLDEQYFACLVECARVGSIKAVERPKIARILLESPALRRGFLARGLLMEKAEFHSPLSSRALKAWCLSLLAGARCIRNVRDSSPCSFASSCYAVGNAIRFCPTAFRDDTHIRNMA